ncbi:MAG TPA: queuosine precursor transporter [Bacteroidales bacterium]|nr:queuosine precursor transporter [Bacteroidales bacterium]
MKHNISPLYVFFGILFTSCLLISNIVSVKLFQLGPWTITAGIVVFPVSYIVNDIISEIWGFKKARFIIWCGFLMNLLAILVYSAAVALPSAGFWQGQEGFASVLQNTPRLAMSSLLAYLTGSFVNSIIMSKMKLRSRGKHFSSRAIVSTIFGESCDSIIFISLAFAGSVPLRVLPQMIVLQIILKTLYEIVILPVTIRIIKKIRKYEIEDIFDENISYNPFKVIQL